MKCQRCGFGYNSVGHKATCHGGTPRWQQESFWILWLGGIGAVALFIAFVVPVLVALHEHTKVFN